MSTKKLQIVTPIVTSVNGETGDVSLDSLKNPNALSFTGAATGSYDGSSAKTVNIPTIPTSLKNPNSITFTGAVSGSYDGSSPMSVPIPTVPSSLKNPNALTFTGADSGSYDGSAAKTVNIPTVPEALRNPNSLTFTGAATGSYDGSSAVNIDIPNSGIIEIINGICDDSETVSFTGLPTGKNAYEVVSSILQAGRIPELVVGNSGGDWETHLRLARNGYNNYIFTNYAITDDGQGEDRIQSVLIISGQESGHYHYMILDNLLNKYGDTMSGALTLNNKLILNSVSYGTSLPSTGVAGQVFFKKV